MLTAGRGTRFTVAQPEAKELPAPVKKYPGGDSKVQSLQRVTGFGSSAIALTQFFEAGHSRESIRFTRARGLPIERCLLAGRCFRRPSRGGAGFPKFGDSRPATTIGSH